MTKPLLEADVIATDWVVFRDEGKVSPGSKTHSFTARAQVSGALLGYVKWFVHWRQYIFFPTCPMIHPNAMQDIAQFAKRATELQRAKAKEKK